MPLFLENKKIEELKALYFIESKSESIIDEKIKEIKAYLKDKVDAGSDIRMFDAADSLDLPDLYNYLNTPSFFSIKKAAIIKNCDKISKEAVKILTDFFLKESDPGEGMVIFLTSPDFKKAFFIHDIVNKYGEIVSIKKPDTLNLKKRVSEKAELDGIKITPEALELFTGNIDGDLNLLENEYEKLYLYVCAENSKTITSDIVKKLVSKNITFTIFNFIDYVGYKNFKMASELVPFLAEDEYGTVLAIKQLYSMFKNVLFILDGERGKLEARKYLEKNTKAKPDFILKILNNHARFAKNYSINEIRKIIGVLNEFDISKRKTSLANINFLYSLLLAIQNPQN